MADLPAGLDEARVGLGRLEGALEKSQASAGGPLYEGHKLCLVDAAYAPFFQRFGMVEDKLRTNVLDEFPRVKAWVAALAEHESVNGSVASSFSIDYIANLQRRGSCAAPLFEAA